MVTFMVGCCVIGCGGFGVSTLRSCAGGCAGAWGTAVLKMDASCFSAVVLFSPRCVMGLDDVGGCSAYVRSVAALVTAYSGNILGKLFWAGNSSVVLDTRSGAVLSM